MKAPECRKILFIDVDGVLNDHRTVTCDPENLLPRQCAVLERVIRETGCVLVITSAWRYVVNPHRMQLWLRARGVPSARVIGRTPTGQEMGLPVVPIVEGGAALMYANESRGDEIIAWLQKQGDVAPPFAIVDDEKKTNMGSLESIVVWTDGSVGLTEADGERLIARLR